MKQSIVINGITCGSCAQKIKDIFKKQLNISEINIDIESWKVDYEYTEFLTNKQIEKMLEGTKYTVSDTQQILADSSADDVVTLSTYAPLFLLFAYISVLSLLAVFLSGNFSIMSLMQYFMAWFFLAFSYFKLINLSEFSMSYAMYDVVAMKWKNWGYIYAFIELWLWILFFVWFIPLLTNILTFVVMSVSIIWVIQSVVQKKKIKCACLWAVFNLPMSTITIIEDALMIAMSGLMVLLILI